MLSALSIPCERRQDEAESRPGNWGHQLEIGEGVTLRARPCPGVPQPATVERESPQCTLPLLTLLPLDTAAWSAPPAAPTASAPGGTPRAMLGGTACAPFERSAPAIEELRRNGKIQSL